MEASTRSGGDAGATYASPSDASPSGASRVADDELVRRVRAGSIDSFEAIFDRYRDPILSFCRHMLGSREDAEDAAQHTFMSAHRGLQGTDRAIELRPWLFAIARNRCLDMLHARRSTDPLEDERAGPASMDGLLETVQRREDLRALVSDIQTLPLAQRAALVMFELGGLSQSQLAEVLGCRPGQVKALIYQARASLMADREARVLGCRGIREELSTARAHDLLRSHLRRHLRVCSGCRDFAGAVRHQRDALALVLPALPSAGLKATVLAGVIGGAGAGTGAGTGAGVAGSAALGGAAATGASSAAGGGAAGAAAPATAAGGSAGAAGATTAATGPAVAGGAGAVGAGAGIAANSVGGGISTGVSSLIGKGLVVKALAVAGLFGAVGGGVTTLLDRPTRAAGPRVPHAPASSSGVRTGLTQNSSSAPTPSLTGVGSGAGHGGKTTHTGSAGPGVSGGGSGGGGSGSAQHPSNVGASPQQGEAGPHRSSGSNSKPTGPPQQTPPPTHRGDGSHGSSGGSGSPPAVSLPALPLPTASPTPAGTPRPVPTLPSVPGMGKLPGVPSPPLPSVSVEGPGSQGGLPSVSLTLPGASVTLGGGQHGSSHDSSGDAGAGHANSLRGLPLPLP